MSPLMGSGIAGQTGLRVLEDRKQDKGSATIHLLRMAAAPARALLQKHLTVRWKGERLVSDDTTVGGTQREL